MAGRAARRSSTLALVLSLGCALPAAKPPPAERPPEEAAATLASRERALLLLMADRRQYDPFSIDAVRRDRPELWPELAISLGRIGDPRGRLELELLLLDDRPEVRRAAAFALGRLGETAAAPALLAAVSDRDRETGRRAVEALARIEVRLVAVVRAAVELAPEERWARLLPELFRFEPEHTLIVAEEALAAAPSADQAWAILALGRQPTVAGRELLRAGLLHPDPWARSWAARGLGSVGEAADLGRLLLLLDDAEAGPVIRALGAAEQLLADGRAAPPDDWIPSLVDRLDDARPAVRASAISAAARWLLEPRLGAVLARRAETGPPRERELALLALATGGDRRAADLAARAAVSPSPTERAAAATAAGLLDRSDLLVQLETDSVPGVRLAVLGARLDGTGPMVSNEARRALLDDDPAVRAAALEWLTENPAAPLEELALAIQGPEARRLVELRLDGLAALTARASAEPLERGAIVALLEVMGRDEDFLVRRAAADALAELGRERPEPGPVDTGWDLARYRQLAGAAVPRRVALETARGRLELELDCAAAPMTCHGFLQLLNQGFYDGLLFHRVVPDFVIQAGDPRGDGWGGPGFTLRDEPNLLRYDRGVVGMARSAPDTAGSQFFITLSPQPHLNGDYTAFGRVVAGDEILDRIVQGDSIERMSEVGVGYTAPR